MKAYHLLGWATLFALSSNAAYAQCWLNNNDNNRANYFLVNGIINQPDPEIIFDLPGNSLGSGGWISTSRIINPGANNRPDEVRFRINTQAMPNKGPLVLMAVDSSAPLSCINCASRVTIPLSKIGWQAAGNTGNTPSDGSFNNGQQTWLAAPANTDHLFFMQFDFLNDTVYPAGTYKGEFYTQGIPQ